MSSQLPTIKWHDIIDNPTIVDAIYDRLINNAYRIELEGYFKRNMIKFLRNDIEGKTHSG